MTIKEKIIIRAMKRAMGKRKLLNIRMLSEPKHRRDIFRPDLKANNAEIMKLQDKVHHLLGNTKLWIQIAKGEIC